MAGIDEAGWFFHVTAWVGAFTAFLAATQGLVALELKKVLAYSTVSQIGYMMLGLGLAGLAPGLLLDGYTAGIFHLVSHALFKACLFLCAGTVIHAVHSIYVTDMGGARAYLPLTWAFTLVAALSLMGLPPFPGFWSKDAVLLVAFDASLPLFVVALITATITAFYTVRFFGMVFHGSPSTHLRQVAASGGHLDDGVAPMRVAVGMLALMIVGAGLGGPWLETVLHHGFAFDASLQLLAGSAGAETEGGSHRLVPILSVLFVLAGAVPAYYVYVARRASPQAWLDASPLLRSVHAFLWNRWSIDRLYTRVFVDGFARMAQRVVEVEAYLDLVVHRRLPWLFTGQVERIVHRLRADTEELFYNVSYVLVLFGLLLMFLFLGTGG